MSHQHVDLFGDPLPAPPPKPKPPATMQPGPEHRPTDNPVDPRATVRLEQFTNCLLESIHPSQYRELADVLFELSIQAEVMADEVEGEQ